jgi:hypothetical protein
MYEPTAFKESNLFLAACEARNDPESKKWLQKTLAMMDNHDLTYIIEGAQRLIRACHQARNATRSQ